MIAKGPPGSGKTRFALQLADELREAFAPWYVSTRASEDALLRHFPTLAPQVLRRPMPRHGLAPAQTLTCTACGSSFDARTAKRPIEVACPNCGEPVRAADRTELHRLIGEVEEGKEPNVRPIPLDLPEIERAYDAVDEHLAESPWRRTLVVFDPIEALDDRYDVR